MRKIYIFILVMILFISFVSCGNSTNDGVDNNNVSESNKNDLTDHSYNLDNIVYDRSNSITTGQDGVAHFNDGIVSYSWKTGEWFFDLYNGFPRLTAIFDGYEVSFALLQRNNGVADSLHYYAACAAKAYYGLSDVETLGQLFFSSSNNYFVKRGYIAERTGYYDTLNNNDSAKNHLSTIYSLTNGINSATVCIDVFAFKEKNAELFQRMFADGAYNEILENYTATIMDSFTLLGDDDKDSLSFERFGYADAYSMFKSLYSQGKTHAEYLEYVDNETELIIKEIDKLYVEILDELKQNYLDNVEPIHPDRTYENYYDTFVLPFIKNYESMRSTAEESYAAYMGLSSTVCYGGTAGSDCTVLWRYVHYRNLRNELLDVKTFLD